MSLLPSSHRARAAYDRLAAPFAAPSKYLLLTPSGARFLDDAAHDEKIPRAFHTHKLTTEPAADITAALAACERLLTPLRGQSVRILLSDLLVRYCLILLDPSAGLADTELLALARGQMSRQQPDTVDWPLRTSLQGNTLLAATSQPDVIERSCAIAKKSGTRLTGIVPLFSHLWDCTPNTARKARDGWLLLEEPGLIMVAFVRAGRIAALHSARLDEDAAAVAVNLLNRQSALQGIAAGGVRLISYAKHPVALPQPWHIVELLRY